jgi:Tfp pilus assembly protein PilF
MTKRNSVAILCKRVQSVMSKERWLDVIKLLRANLSLVEKDWELSWNLAWCFKLDQMDEAKTHMERAVGIAPKNSASRYGLGRIYLERKQFKKAETNFAASLRLRDFYAARLALALTYMKQSKNIKAEGIYSEGIKLQPKEARRYEAYADFLSDVGREKEAQTMYKKATNIRRAVRADQR